MGRKETRRGLLLMVALLLVMLGYGLAQVPGEVIERYRQMFSAEVEVVPVERAFLVATGDEGRAFATVFSFRDGETTCYMLWGEDRELSCR